MTVDLSHNNIISVTDKAFARNSDLISLRLDHNKISQISNLSFFGLQNAELISLRNNEISELPPNVFQFAKNVQKVVLARNSIKSIHKEAFSGLSQGKLKILHLENNFLTEVPTQALAPLESLAELHLSGNPLKVLQGDAFLHFHTLTHLDLSSSRLEEVHNLAFNGLGGTLRSLKLSDNSLRNVPSEALKRVQALHSLHLGQNPLEVLPASSLASLTSLKRLDISGCSKLISIEAKAFHGLKDLKHAYINLNRGLNFIHREAFDPSMTNLNSLNLADNALPSLPSTLVPWSKLKALDLRGNPWNCQACELSFLPKVLHALSSNANISEQIIAGQCTSGQSLYDAQIKCNELSSENTDLNTEFFIQSEVHNTKNTEDVLSQEDVLLRQHEATNATAVIVSVSIVSTVVLLTILALLYMKFCKKYVQDWIKEYRWKRHDHTSSYSHNTAIVSGGNTAAYSSYYQPYLKGDNYIYTSPRLHHTYVYHGQSPLHHTVQTDYYCTTSASNTQNTTSSTDNEDEYFYVSNPTQTHYNESAVVMNNGSYATTTGTNLQAKHIPVTVL